MRGFGILQPRVGVSLPSAYRSRFAAIHSGHPGVDPYTTAVSDVYQDLYGEGSFTGKGIYDVDAFEQATRGRFPENTLLSHDLIEGSYARAGLATDIQVFDDYPSRYLAYARRKHRWIRGDWQLLRWLGRWVPGPDGRERNRLSLLSRWKLFDNLRRSLLEIAQLAFFVAGWTIFPGSPLRWTRSGCWRSPRRGSSRSCSLPAVRRSTSRGGRTTRRSVTTRGRASSSSASPSPSCRTRRGSPPTPSCARCGGRSVSGRHLLEWQTASQAERATSGSARVVWGAMWPAVAIAGVAVVLLVLRAGHDEAMRWPLVVGRAAPHRPVDGVARGRAGARGADGASKRRLAAPLREEAMRYARAHWLFFERFVGAETNWLAPDNFQDDPDPVVAMRTSPTNIGLQLLATVSAYDLGFISADTMAKRLEQAFRSLERMGRFRGHFYNWYDLQDLRVLEPAYISTVDSGNLAGHLIALRQACLTIAKDAKDADARDAARARSRISARRTPRRWTSSSCSTGSASCSRSATRSARTRSTASSYDLLASEARLASFVAIAKNDVPVDHWFRLGRTLTHASGETALVSWSGSMFEYLMPALVMRSFPQTVLDQTCHGAVRRQISYAAERGVPWGISESAYNVRDRHLTYQYRAFGVPDLALKRGLGRDLVVAPYATALAAMVDAPAALANIATLERRGALGEYGFRDALDYTRPAPGESSAIVKNYMAHHIGMSIVALTNVLEGDVWQRAVPRRPARALRRAAAARAHPAAARLPAGRARRRRRGAPRAGDRAARRARVRHAGHRAAARRAARPSAVHDHGQQPRLGLQPLRGDRRHPLARRRDDGQHRAVLLREGRDDAAACGARRTSRCARRPIRTAPRSPPTASRSTAWTGTSRRGRRSPSCRRTRRRSGASR